MINQPDKEVAEALHRLSSNADFQKVGEWLRSSIQVLRVENDSVVEVETFRRNQGAINAQKEILEYVQNSGKILSRYRSNR